MAAVSVRIYPEAIKALLTGPNGPVVKDLTRRGRRVENQAKINCPVDSGRLRASIHLRHVLIHGEPGVEIVAATNYARWVHDGTGIYGPRHQRIYPRTAKFLRFRPKGSRVFVYARSVAGMRGRPFLTDALAAARG